MHVNAFPNIPFQESQVSCLDCLDLFVVYWFQQCLNLSSKILIESTRVESWQTHRDLWAFHVGQTSHRVHTWSFVWALRFPFRRHCVALFQEETADKTWKERAQVHWFRAHLHCWKNRMQNVLFDTADLLPHPTLLCRGSLGFMVRDYSRPQKQLLKPPIKADSCSGWEGRPTVGAQNMQMCRTMEASAQSRTAQPYYPLLSSTAVNILPALMYTLQSSKLV